jgi:hypothetical protein
MRLPWLADQLSLQGGFIEAGFMSLEQPCTVHRVSRLKYALSLRVGLGVTHNSNSCILVYSVRYLNKSSDPRSPSNLNPIPIPRQASQISN